MTRQLRRLLANAVCIVTLMAATAQLHAHGSLDTRIREISRQIASNPGNALLYLERAELLRSGGRVQSARADYERALFLAPDLHAAELGGALLLRDEGDPDAALRSVDRLLISAPHYHRAHLVRAELLASAGKLSQAIVSMERAVDLSPRAAPEMYLRLARMLTEADPPDTVRALSILDGAMDRLGVLATLQRYAIELEESRGRYDRALDRVDSLLPQFERKELLLARRGEILESASRPLEALVAYTEALDAIAALRVDLRATPASQRREAFIRDRLRILSPEVAP